VIACTFLTVVVQERVFHLIVMKVLILINYCVLKSCAKCVYAAKCGGKDELTEM